MQNFLTKLWNDESGQDLVEYALLLAFLAVAAIAVLGLLGPRIVGVFQTATDALPAGTP